MDKMKLIYWKIQIKCRGELRKRLFGGGFNGESAFEPDRSKEIRFSDEVGIVQ